MKPLATIFTMLVIALAVAAYSYLIRPVVNPTPSFAVPEYSSSSGNDTILAFSIGKMIARRGTRPAPNPDKPKVGDTCPHCEGSGREPGDGTVDLPCGQCLGDGRVDEGDPIISDSSDPIELEIRIVPLPNPLNEPEPIDPTIDSEPEFIVEFEPRITVDIEGIVYTYDPHNGYFYMPDRSRILSLDPIPLDEIGEIRSIQTCDDATGICKEYLLRDE